MCSCDCSLINIHKGELSKPLVFCGINNHLICHLQNPDFWTHRPLSELMVRAAADDVRFLLYIYHKMMEKLTEQSLWHLVVRGALYCRCFCINDNDYADWPPLPPIPGSSVLDLNCGIRDKLCVNGCKSSYIFVHQLCT